MLICLEEFIGSILLIELCSKLRYLQMKFFAVQQQLFFRDMIFCLFLHHFAHPADVAIVNDSGLKKTIFL